MKSPTPLKIKTKITKKRKRKSSTGANDLSILEGSHNPFKRHKPATGRSNDGARRRLLLKETTISTTNWMAPKKKTTSTKQPFFKHGKYNPMERSRDPGIQPRATGNYLNNLFSTEAAINQTKHTQHGILLSLCPPLPYHP